jgi:hypothetical protein
MQELSGPDSPGAAAVHGCDYCAFCSGSGRGTGGAADSAEAARRDDAAPARVEHGQEPRGTADAGLLMLAGILHIKIVWFASPPALTAICRRTLGSGRRGRLGRRAPSKTCWTKQLATRR